MGPLANRTLPDPTHFFCLMRICKIIQSSQLGFDHHQQPVTSALALPGVNIHHLYDAMVKLAALPEILDLETALLREKIIDPSKHFPQIAACFPRKKASELYVYNVYVYNVYAYNVYVYIDR